MGSGELITYIGQRTLLLSERIRFVCGALYLREGSLSKEFDEAMYSQYYWQTPIFGPLAISDHLRVVQCMCLVYDDYSS